MLVLVDAQLSVSEAAHFSPKESLVRRTFHWFKTSPSVATWCSFAARSLPLVVLPLVVFRAFSETQSALWFVFITIQGMQLLLESNVGLTFIRSIGFALGGASQVADQRSPIQRRGIAEPNIPLLCDIWGAMRRAYSWIGVLTLCIAIAAVYMSARGLVSNLEQPVDGWIAAAVFCIGAAARAYGGLHISYLYGVGQITLLRWWEMLFWLISFCAAFVSLWLQLSLAMVSIVYQLPLFANLALNAALARREQYGRDPKFHALQSDRRSYDLLGQLWPAIWRSGLGIGIYLGVTQGAGLYYATIGDPVEVAVYLFAMSLMRPMIQFAQVPFFTKLPKLASLQAAGDKVRLLQVASRGMKISHFTLALAICFVAAVLPVVERLGGRAAEIPLLLWSTIGLAAFLERVGAMHLQLYSQTNHIVWHWANGVAAVIFVVIAATLVPRIGSLAFPVALALACLLYYIPYCIFLTRREFKLSLIGEAKNMLPGFFVVLSLQGWALLGGE